MHGIWRQLISALGVTVLCLLIRETVCTKFNYFIYNKKCSNTNWLLQSLFEQLAPRNLNFNRHFLNLSIQWARNNASKSKLAMILMHLQISLTHNLYFKPLIPITQNNKFKSVYYYLGLSRPDMRGQVSLGPAKGAHF